MTYIIEVAVTGDACWTLETVKANNSTEAKAKLLEIYGKDAFFGYCKALN